MAALILARILVAIALALAAASAVAQRNDQAEITFWESVRDSKDPAELRAYLQRYPNGTFAFLAQRRLAVLEGAPAAPQPQAAPAAVQPQRAPAPAVARPPHILQPGDSWTYRLSSPRRFGVRNEPPRTQVVTLTSAETGHIVDAFAMDGGTPLSTSHEAKPTALVQGAAIFSPYPFALDKMQGGRWFRSVIDEEPSCARAFICETKARIAGNESVQVPAGTFFATKVILEQEWRQGAGQLGARQTGGRTLTIWYAPEIGRAVKFSSRVVVGDQMPIDPNFDLDLISYQLK